MKRYILKWLNPRTEEIYREEEVYERDFDTLFEHLSDDRRIDHLKKTSLKYGGSKVLANVDEYGDLWDEILVKEIL